MNHPDISLVSGTPQFLSWLWTIDPWDGIAPVIVTMDMATISPADAKLQADLKIAFPRCSPSPASPFPSKPLASFLLFFARLDRHTFGNVKILESRYVEFV